MQKIDVLDKGYVRLTNVFGTEADICSAARVSYGKESKLVNGKLEDRDAGLIKFLWNNSHFSPFRHVYVSFEISAPMVVKNQWFKHVVGSSHIENGMTHNEVSHRYVAEADEFYIPSSTEWRSKPANSKQGSGDPIDPRIGQVFSQKLQKHVEDSQKLYDEFLAYGVAPEVARLALPAYAMYIKWRWSVSLEGFLHFLKERQAKDAQFEIREYANAARKLVEPSFPNTFAAAFSEDV